MNVRTVRSVTFSLSALICVLRHMRVVRGTVRQEIRGLQERHRGGHDGTHLAAVAILEMELALIEEAIAQLWSASAKI